MAANEIVIKVKLDDSGSFKLVEKEAKKAAKATDDLGKSRNRYNKGEKGVIGATSNGTKAFSKMRDSMTGSTGLVSAYAVLASNVFAATAAFNAFRRAAQVGQLEKGLIAVGAAAGQNLPDVAKGLRAITGEALSAEQAMRATALASASGFRSDQLQDLAKVAKGASLALGRDMGDAFDRLVRGTAKVEPEILDELGIFVRLDEAVQNYADQLGVAASSLTQSERSQAFLNATLEQGLKKYQDLSEVIDPNPYDKLAASLANLQKEFLEFFNDFAGLGDAVSFASRNLFSLTAVATTLGGAVTSTVAPGLLRMAESSAESAEGLFQARSEMAQTLTKGKGLPPLFTALSQKLEDGTATSKDFGQAQASLLGKLGANQRQLNAFEKSMQQNNDTSKEAIVELDRLKATKADLQNRLVTLKEVQQAQTDASISASRASALNNASSLRLVDAFKDLGQAHKEDAKNTREGAKEKRGFGKALTLIGPSARTAAGGLKVLGAALFTFLPYIGLIISGVSILYGIIKEKFFPEDLVQKRIDEAIASFENFEEIQKSFERSQAQGGTRLANSYIAYAGVLDQIIAKIKEVNQSSRDEFRQTTFEMEREINRLTAAAAEARSKEAETLARGVTYDDLTSSTQKLVDSGDLSLEAAIEMRTKILQLQLRSNGLQKQANEMVAEKNKAEAGLEAILKANAAAVLRGAMDELEIRQEIAKRSGEVTPFSIATFNEDMAELSALYDKLLNDSSYTAKQFEIDFALIQRMPNEIRSSFQNMDEAIAKANASIVAVATKARKPYQDVEEGIEGVLNNISGLEEAAKETQYALGAGFVPTAKAKESAALLKEQEENLKKLRIPQKFLNDMGDDGLIGAARKFLDFIHKLQEDIPRLSKEAERLAVISKEIAQATSGIAGAEIISLTAANTARNKKIELLQTEINGLRTIADTDERHAQAVKDIANKTAQINKLTQENISPKEIELKAEQSLLKLTQERNKLAAIRVANDLKAMKISAIAEKGFVNAKDEAKFRNVAAQNAIKAAKLEYDLLEAQFSIRIKLLDAQLTASGVDFETRQEILGLLNDELIIQRQIADEKIRGAALDAGAGLSGSGAGVVEGPRASPLSRIAGTVEGELGGVLSSTAGIYDKFAAAGANVATARSNLADRQSEETEAASALSAHQAANPEGPPNAQEEQLVAAYEAAKLRTEEAKTASQAALQEINATAISMYTGLLESQAKAMASLGPEGQVAAQFTMFSANMLTSFEAFAETGEGTAERIAAGFQMAAAAISGIANIMQAKNNAAIAAIDQQIAAEKKRDGKSAASLQKIQALEKKKEAAKKKAFEQNKKMQMAQVVISTAAGIASAYAAAAAASVAAGPGAPAAFAAISSMMVGLIAATGAIQLALIAGTSYQGGGSISSGGGAPSSISVGQRKSSVDMAKSQGGAGELAYFRGGRGIGGPESFTPAFTGYKNRAAGGNAAFMVGEQGPELFVPETPGRIVPNDEVDGAGTPVNATINISAVDAAGVEDVLMNQRGNIISMIRDAANAQGNTFLEEVNVSEL